MTQDQILMAAYRLISGHPDKTALAGFHAQQAIILERRSDAGAQVRASIHDSADRFEEYERLDEAKDQSLFRAIWSHFPEVRKEWPSSELSNNELEASF